MEPLMTAVETTGTLRERRRLDLDEALPLSDSTRVRVIVLYPAQEEIPESEWLRAAAKNPALQDLDDPAEDIYSLQDGEPFLDPL